MNEVFDYIVVGAGLSGMLTSALLEEKGKKNLLLEKNKEIGGYIRNISLGVPFGAHHVGIPDMKLLKQIAKKINLDYERYFTRKDEISVEVDDKVYNLSLYLQQQKLQLMNLFPLEKEGIRNYYDYLAEVSEALYSEENKQIKSYFIQLANCTFDTFLRRFFTDEKLIRLLAFMGPSYGGVDSFDSAFTFVSLIVTYGNGAYYLDGEGISHAIGEKFSNNKTVELKKEFYVKSLHFDQINDCYEIISDANECVRGRKVIFASCFKKILKEYYENAGFKNKALEKIFNMEVGMSAYRIYFKVNKKLNRREYVHVGVKGSSELMKNSYIVSTLNHDQCNVMFTMVTDKGMNKEEINCFCLEAAKVIEDRFDIGGRDISCVAISTPVDKCIRTGNEAGAVFGWKRNCQNNMNANLIYSINKMLKNVYVVGNWSATFGVFGVLYTVNKLCKGLSKEE